MHALNWERVTPSLLPLVVNARPACSAHLTLTLLAQAASTNTPRSTTAMRRMCTRWHGQSKKRQPCTACARAARPGHGARLIHSCASMSLAVGRQAGSYDIICITASLAASLMPSHGWQVLAQGRVWAREPARER